MQCQKEAPSKQNLTPLLFSSITLGTKTSPAHSPNPSAPPSAAILMEGIIRLRLGAPDSPAARVGMGSSAELPRAIRQTTVRSSVTSAISGTGCALANLSFLTYRIPSSWLLLGRPCGGYALSHFPCSIESIGIPTLRRLRCEDDLGT